MSKNYSPSSGRPSGARMGYSKPRSGGKASPNPTPTTRGAKVQGASSSKMSK